MTTEHRQACIACGQPSICWCGVSADHSAPHCFACWDPILDQAVVAVCSECGGKYRPAGGPCVHDHPAVGVPDFVRVWAESESSTLKSVVVAATGALVAPGSKPRCVKCGKLVEDMGADEIFNCARMGTSPRWGETKNVACPSCRDEEE